MTNARGYDFTLLPMDAASIVASVCKRYRRVLLFGAPGAGKSTLATQIARILYASQPCYCLSADPGSPLFGVPGAVCLGYWQKNTWRLDEYVALCTLDAGRFRLPLVSAARQLLQRDFDGVVLIDSPGVVRGIAGSELLAGLADAVHADAILAISTAGSTSLPLMQELRALATKVFVVPAAVEAIRPGKRLRARRRTQLWDAYLSHAIKQQIALGKINLIGTPPPLKEACQWIGRQVALLQAQHTVAMGEVQQFDGQILTLSLPAEVSHADTLLIRDAHRTEDGVIETAPAYAAEQIEYFPPADVMPSVNRSDGPRLFGRVGTVDVAMINGVFGAPLLHVRLRHQRRSLLFDLGNGERLPARVAHQVTEVFISHAHLDHIGGFLWLLRSRIGDFPRCRLFGPPGLAQHIAGFLRGVLWDRVTFEPSFAVLEYHGDCLQHYILQATQPEPQYREKLAVKEGVLHEEAGFRIRAVVLDHQGTAVMAYAYEPDQQINVRKDRLVTRRLVPGSWLTELKQQLLSKNVGAHIRLPDGSETTVAALAAELLVIRPGKKLVYATDLADTLENRQRLIGLAQNAHTFFCEAMFDEALEEHAKRNGHLTARACGEIAASAQVARLVPFHFSRRYLAKPQQIYDEVKSACLQTVVPRQASLLDASADASKNATIRSGST